MQKLLLLLSILVTLSGCAVTDEAAKTAEVAAAGNERYHVLAQKALDGDADPAKDGLEPISGDEWKATPRSVRVLVERLLNGLGVNRHAFYSIAFQLDAGPDPDTLELKPVSLPEDENAALIEDDQ